jgi:hypothetical protein
MGKSLPVGVNILMPYRRCTCCGEEKPTTRDNFGTKENGLPRPRCRACTREATNRHASNNRELGRERARRREEREKAVGVVNEHHAFREALLYQQDNQCYFCKTSIDEETSEIDHLIPIVRVRNYR